MANNEGDRSLRVAVLGAGPVGLDAALASLDAGYEINVYDAGLRPSNNVRDWGHVRLFSPWSMNVSPRMRCHATRVGLTLDVDDEPHPTRVVFETRIVQALRRWRRFMIQVSCSIYTHDSCRSPCSTCTGPRGTDVPL